MTPATEPQKRYMRILGIDEDVIETVTKHQAITMISNAIEHNNEKRQAKYERRQQEAQEAQRRMQEQRQQLEEQAKVHAERMKVQRTYDPVTKLIGTEKQRNYADKIRRSLTPYLRQLRTNTIPGSDMRQLLDAAVRQTDACFWIAYKSVDVDEASMKKMLTDVRRREMLERVTPDAVSDNADETELLEWEP